MTGVCPCANPRHVMDAWKTAPGGGGSGTWTCLLMQDRQLQRQRVLWGRTCDGEALAQTGGGHMTLPNSHCHQTALTWAECEVQGKNCTWGTSPESQAGSSQPGLRAWALWARQGGASATSAWGRGVWPCAPGDFQLPAQESTRCHPHTDCLSSQAGAAAPPVAMTTHTLARRAGSQQLTQVIALDLS